MDLELFAGATRGEIADLYEDSNEELDLPPEYHRYRDEGCEVASAFLHHQSSCLNCPFPKCVYEQDGGKQHWLKQLRDREMLRLFNTGGKEMKGLAEMFGVSQRTVQRAIKRLKEDDREK
ncbi:hypothetical protein ACFLUE_02875 [Chloroflexota bacterium]